MDPENIGVDAIASGHYDGYLTSYAEAVRALPLPGHRELRARDERRLVLLGLQRTSPATFVAAWRHIVTLFRALGARNVTWLWTVNVMDDTRNGKIPSPVRWWPGRQYVTWVGIDGYYLKPSLAVRPAVRADHRRGARADDAPILIAETGAAPAAGQPAKIADLFAGIRSYGLLGFVWFDSTNNVGQAFGLSSPAAIAAFRTGASTYRRPGS